MRSLTLKLTLAFLLVGLIGSLLVALIVGLRTRSEVDLFLSVRDRTILLNALRSYYQANGGWQESSNCWNGQRRSIFTVETWSWRMRMAWWSIASTDHFVLVAD